VRKISVSRATFIAEYTSGDPDLYEKMMERGRFAIPCACGYPPCKGWQMAHADEVERYLSRTLLRRDPK
jgi:hypothetical protein